MQRRGIRGPRPRATSRAARARHSLPALPDARAAGTRWDAAAAACPRTDRERPRRRCTRGGRSSQGAGTTRVPTANNDRAGERSQRRALVSRALGPRRLPEETPAGACTPVRPTCGARWTACAGLSSRRASQGLELDVSPAQRRRLAVAPYQRAEPEDALEDAVEPADREWPAIGVDGPHDGLVHRGPVHAPSLV